jgi:hypothetical protein
MTRMLAAAHSRNHDERPGDCGRSRCGHRHYDAWRGTGGSRLRRRGQRARERRLVTRELAELMAQ